jgi:hypothetical protein
MAARCFPQLSSTPATVYRCSRFGGVVSSCRAGGTSRGNLRSCSPSTTESPPRMALCPWPAASLCHLCAVRGCPRPSCSRAQATTEKQGYANSFIRSQKQLQFFHHHQQRDADPHGQLADAECRKHSAVGQADWRHVLATFGQPHCELAGYLQGLYWFKGLLP